MAKKHIYVSRILNLFMFENNYCADYV